jgi:hypothetical protein
MAGSGGFVTWDTDRLCGEILLLPGVESERLAALVRAQRIAGEHLAAATSPKSLASCFNDDYELMPPLAIDAAAALWERFAEAEGGGAAAGAASGAASAAGGGESQGLPPADMLDDLTQAVDPQVLAVGLNIKEILIPRSWLAVDPVPIADGTEAIV